MKILDEFLNQELDGWLKTGAGHFVGAWGVLSLAVTLFAARAYVINFFNNDYSVRIVAGIFLLVTALISYWLLHTAYRLIKNKP
jgi:hypothetical protein